MSATNDTVHQDGEASGERVRRTVIGLTLAIGAILTLIGATITFLPIAEPVRSAVTVVLVGFGVSFTSSAVISFIMLSAGFMDLSKSAIDLAGAIGTKLGMPCAERFVLVDSCIKVGVAKAYISRREALGKANFCRILRLENDQLFIVGSSLLGLLQDDKHFSHVVQLLRDKITEGVELKFMLTHPLFADFRAAQEGRTPKEIAEEIIRSLRLISKMNEELHKGHLTVYLYRGTPTCFGICATRGMLLNPYPYGRQAYESPCFEFAGETAAYNFYRQAHFQTQFGGKIEEFNLTEDNIKLLEDRVNEFSEMVHKFEASFKPSSQ